MCLQMYPPLGHDYHNAPLIVMGRQCCQSPRALLPSNSLSILVPDRSFFEILFWPLEIALSKMLQAIVYADPSFDFNT